MFKNIDVSRAKETFVVKYYILKVQHDKSFSCSNLFQNVGNYWETSTGFKLQDNGDISSSGSTLSPDESENEEEGDPPPSQASTAEGGSSIQLSPKLCKMIVRFICGSV